MDRRALVFTIFAVICFALYPLADKYDGASGWSWSDKGWAWVPVVLGAVYLVLALLSLLDARTKSHLQPRPLGYDRSDVPGRGGSGGSADPGADESAAGPVAEGELPTD